MKENIKKLIDEKNINELKNVINKMNISDDVVRKYLKIGEECNKCLYKKLNNIK